MKPFKVIGIGCSPRMESNSDILVRAVLAAAVDNGAATEFVKIADHDISPCDACWRCAETGECHIHDDMQSIYAGLLQADGIVIGSPVHMGHSISGNAQVFLDRTFSLWHHKRLKNKVGGSVAVANRRGGISAVRIINDVFLDQQILVAGYVTGYARAPGDIHKDARAFKEAGDLGKRMHEVMVSIRK
ncbi:MAG: flavodoxin family protein [Desulfobacterales bacterium]|nr:flavodoxin family protein [Desulfobacterales bacterium]